MRYGSHVTAVEHWTSDDWLRLKEEIVAQRLALGYPSAARLAAAAGVSERTVQHLESGKPRVAGIPRKAPLVERALLWRPGSMRRILDGGIAIPMDRTEPTAIAAEERALLLNYLAWADVGADAKRRLRAQLDALPDMR